MTPAFSELHQDCTAQTLNFSPDIPAKQNLDPALQLCKTLLFHSCQQYTSCELQTPALSKLVGGASSGLERWCAQKLASASACATLKGSA
jgi:hypothetical protein